MTRRRSKSERRASDWELLHSAGEGNDQALRILREKHDDVIAAAVAKSLGRPLAGSDADDLANRTWYQAMRRSRYGVQDASQSYSDWLIGVALEVLHTVGGGESPPEHTLPAQGIDPVSPCSSVSIQQAALRAELAAALSSSLRHLSAEELETYRYVYERGLSPAEVAQQLNESKGHVVRWRIPRLHQAVASQLRAEGLGQVIVADGTRPLAMLVPISARLRQILRVTPDEYQSALDALSFDEFEVFVAERLEAMKYRVYLQGHATQPDGGIDILAFSPQGAPAPHLIAVQVKHHSGNRKAGAEGARQLLAVKGSDINIGLLVTNTEFTPAAIALARSDVHRGYLWLRDFEDLQRWVEDHFDAPEEWRDLPRELTLPSGVTIPIPKSLIVPPDALRAC